MSDKAKAQIERRIAGLRSDISNHIDFLIGRLRDYQIQVDNEERSYASAGVLQVNGVKLDMMVVRLAELESLLAVVS